MILQILCGLSLVRFQSNRNGTDWIFLIKSFMVRCNFSIPAYDYLSLKFTIMLVVLLLTVRILLRKVIFQYIRSSPKSVCKEYNKSASGKFECRLRFPSDDIPP